MPSIFYVSAFTIPKPVPTSTTCTTMHAATHLSKLLRIIFIFTHLGCNGNSIGTDASSHHHTEQQGKIKIQHTRHHDETSL